MATRIYSLDYGQNKNQVTEGVGSATTVTFELTIDLADNVPKGEVLRAIDEIRRYIEEHKWPPA